MHIMAQGPLSNTKHSFRHFIQKYSLLNNDILGIMEYILVSWGFINECLEAMPAKQAVLLILFFYEKYG